MMQNSNKDSGPNSSKGAFIAVILSVVFYFAWTQYLNKKYPDFNKQKSQSSDTTSTPTNDAKPEASNTPSSSTANTNDSSNTNSTSTLESAALDVPQLAEKDLTFENETAVYKFNQKHGSLESIVLKNYRESIDPTSSPIQLLHRPFIVQGQPSAIGTSVKPVVYSAQRKDSEITFSYVEGNWQVIQKWQMPEKGYAGKLEIEFKNTSAEPANLLVNTFFEMGAKNVTSKGSFFNPGSPNEQPRFLTQADGDDNFETMETFCKDRAHEVNEKNRKLDFFGFDYHYFALAFIPTVSFDFKTKSVNPNSNLCELVTIASINYGNILAGQSSTQKWDFWFGPKDVELLGEFNPHLRTTLGLGMLDMIAHPLLLAIKGLHKFSGNYGVAIILLTLLLKLLFYPLARQAAISAAKMKQLNPEMTRIREKFKAEPQKMQMELMKFMSQHKINPMKGCLPILPTIPVFFALFRVLSASIDLRHAPFYGWIHDLSAMDPFYVTPIILTGFMFIQQKMTPMTGMDPTQEKIMTFMPLIFGVMMISLPSGLVLYMLTNTIVSILQQQYLNRKLAPV